MKLFQPDVMLKLFSKLLFSIVLILLAACNQHYTDQYIEIKDDGLIYKVGRDQPYTGKIIDTLNQRILEYDVVNGLKNGEFKILLFNGNLSVDGFVENNRNTGEWKYYYPSGQLESHGNFKNDKPYGKWTWYYSSGNIREEGTFFNGYKMGDWYTYTEDGRITSMLSYYEGDKINEVKVSKNL